MRRKITLAALGLYLLGAHFALAAQPAPALGQQAEASAISQPAPTETDLANSRWETTKARRELETLRKEYDGWKTANAKVFETKAENERLAAEAETLRKEIQALKADNEKLSSRRNIYWMLAGAAVFLVAFLFGNAFGASKKRGGGGYKF